MGEPKEEEITASRRRAVGSAYSSVSDRVAYGKAVRAKVPRSSHAAWAPPAKRPGAVQLLEQQAKTRVPELVPIRYGRMLVSPFTFYRGAGVSMATDLADSRTPGWWPSSAATRTSRTSARSRRRTAGWCSPSTTSTRRSRGRSSGT